MSATLPTTVALVRGDDRFANLSQALKLIDADLDLSARRLVVVKPNLVSTERRLAVTHPEAVRAVLEAVRARYSGRLVIAEGSAVARTGDAFEHFGYDALARHYRAELIDLNADATVGVQVYDRWLRPRTLGLARTIVESDYRIAVGPPKTHDTVIVTLTLKNMIMGALVNRGVAGEGPLPKARFPDLLRRIARALSLRAPLPGWVERQFQLSRLSDKLAMHQGFPTINLNLALIAPIVRPHLALIDGYTAMEGAGPVDGDPVEWRAALAGSDALAVDRLASRLMGIDPDQVGYLAYCKRMGLSAGDPDSINLVGNVEPAAVRRVFRLHPTVAHQRRWQRPAIARYLRPAALRAV